jgi:hypothetical protein
MADIRETVFTIRELAVQRVLIPDDFKVFSVKYPKLFAMACDVEFNLDHLDVMITMLENMKNEKVSKETADKEIQDMLTKVYVDPLVG